MGQQQQSPMHTQYTAKQGQGQHSQMQAQGVNGVAGHGYSQNGPVIGPQQQQQQQQTQGQGQSQPQPQQPLQQQAPQQIPQQAPQQIQQQIPQQASQQLQGQLGVPAQTPRQQPMTGAPQPPKPAGPTSGVPTSGLQSEQVPVSGIKDAKLNGTQRGINLTQQSNTGSSRPVMTRGVMPNGYSNSMSMLGYRRQMSNVEVLKVLDFCELVGVRSESTKNILYWKKIITEYFSEVGVLRYSVKSGVDHRQFEFSVPIIPRFFFSIIQSGVLRIEIQPGMLRTQMLANGTTYIESLRCCFTHHYNDGSYVNIYGTMKGVFNQSLKFEWLDFQTHVFIPGVEWPSLEKVLSDETKMKEMLSVYSDETKDESGSSTKQQQILQKFRSNYQVFHSMSNFGLQESVMRVMQVSDVMAHLRSLMLFSISSNSCGPLQALDDFVAKAQSKEFDKAKKKLDGGVSSGQASGNVSAKDSPATDTMTINNTSTTTANQNATNSEHNHSGKTGTNNGTASASTTGTSNSSSTTNLANGASTTTGSGNGGASNAQDRKGVHRLDMSQSTLTKRRRKSTLGELSPKSIGESPKVKAKKTKR